VASQPSSPSVFIGDPLFLPVKSWIPDQNRFGNDGAGALGNGGFDGGCAMEKQPAVYILASGYNGTLYIGVTSNLIQRIWQHKNDMVEGFTEKYGVHFLVHYELCDQMLTAIEREKQLKKWNRQWKIDLIEKRNPTWKDLWEELV
jgi:putative endonuclease